MLQKCQNARKCQNDITYYKRHDFMVARLYKTIQHSPESGALNTHLPSGPVHPYQFPTLGVSGVFFHFYSIDIPVGKQ